MLGRIIYSANGIVGRRNVRTDENNYPLFFVEEGETSRLVLDFTGRTTETSETISSATVSNDGITATPSTSSPLVTLTLSGSSSYGQTTVTVTFSSGDIVVQKITVREKQRPSIPTGISNTDYGNSLYE